MNREDLIAAFQELELRHPIEGDDFWSQRRREIRQRMIAEGPENFLTWSVIIATMFVDHHAPYHLDEYRFIVAESGGLGIEEYKRWTRAIVDPGIGNPVRAAHLWANPEQTEMLYTSGNFVHQAYHLARWEAHTGKKINELDWVVEFGGGYGALAHVARRAGFRNAYIIIDFPELSLLQQWYLDQAGTANIGHSLVPYVHGEVDLLVALWSMSEAPEVLQDDILEISARYILLAFDDNHGNFAERTMADRRYAWTREPTAVEGHSYLYGIRKEEPKAAPQRKRRK